MREEFSAYLNTLDRLGEPGLVFGSPIDVEAIRSAMEAAFPGRHVFTLRANGPTEPKPEEIRTSVLNSFEGQGVLAVVIGTEVSTSLMKIVEQLCEDEGFYHEKPEGGWTRLKPPTSWRMVVFAEVAELSVLSPRFTDLFASPFAL